MTEAERDLLLLCATITRAIVAQCKEEMVKPDPMGELFSMFMKASPEGQAAQTAHNTKLSRASAALAEFDEAIEAVFPGAVAKMDVGLKSAQ